MDLEIVGCKNRWIELAQCHAHWRALALPRCTESGVHCSLPEPGCTYVRVATVRRSCLGGGPQRVSGALLFSVGIVGDPWVRSGNAMAVS
jgi:hypothetical protein